MKTKILKYDEPYALNQATVLLLQGDTVALPTETVYGLAANASDPVALKKIFEAKRRPSNHPLIVHIHSVLELPKWAINIPEQAYQLAATFWPGPLTLVLEKAPWVPSELTGGQNTIAIRVPAHPVMQSVLELSGLGLAAPSANPYQKISATTAEHVHAGLAGKISLIVDGGPCAVGIESTILDVTQTPPRILRAGPLRASDIAVAISHIIETPEKHSVSISGNEKSHYQPNAKLFLMSAEEIKEAVLTLKGSLGVLFYNADLHHDLLKIIESAAFNNDVLLKRLPTEKVNYTQLMYATLHEFDMARVENILVEYPPNTEEWLDVNDRLKRASSPKPSKKDLIETTSVILGDLG